ncbi:MULTISPECIES: glutathione synthase [Gammaproteobacteria]|uniref:glutathione synthase n=1 Tax=Gammaproteobacteria TaxID=1236 RepID=UPI000DD0E7CF|nr:MULTISPECIES: glutathione synthase [Gammaproteobacteria]RTE85611.1 glutathione synthase [Aliidiomarina sp. B3213]TCZ89580.1 glutathione synthase [Lysobacter sp. N42]
MARIGIVMDPIATITPYKDTSFRLALEGQSRGHDLFYLELKDLFVENGTPYGQVKSLEVRDQNQDFYTLGEQQTIKLGELDAIIMRKDPPFDTEFVYATHILDLAKRDGALIANNPQSLRDCSEKLFTAWFPEHIPATLVTRDAQQIRKFHEKHGTVIMKPLDGMGGASIFKVNPDGNNLGVIIETLTEHGSRYAMAQQFLPEIVDGDKRILIINGEPVPYALARIPSKGETRGNLAAGGTGRAQPLSDTDWEVARAIGPILKEKGLYLVGLDVIGNKITEINVTSPTCMREIEAAFDINIAKQFFEAIEADFTRN